MLEVLIVLLAVGVGLTVAMRMDVDPRPRVTGAPAEAPVGAEPAVAESVAGRSD
jgi:hypothetical protein